jgi:molybdate/tungstate transport system ATP-binding protein
MIAGIAVEALALTLGAFRLEKLDFALSRAEILVILGPNGSGKSVTLETIAGFHRPDSGRVLIHGRDVSGLPPERRNIGFVVQDFGLFPHLSVAQNIAIVRRSERGWRGERAAPRPAAFPPPGDAAALLAYFGVAHLARRAPQGLSPGEKQRVALARALAGAPDLFLFDEPFSALDAQTRDQLREELKSFLRALSIPAIFVTHDHTDAMTLADKIVVLRDGVMMQSGPAAEIFRKPASSFVARFVGVENILPARITQMSGDCATLAVGGGDRTLRAAAPAAAAGAAGSVYLSIRAEDVTLCSFFSPHGEPPRAGVNRLQGRVIGLRNLGPLVTVQIDCGFPLKAYLLIPQARKMHLGDGSPVAVEIAAQAIHVMMD